MLSDPDNICPNVTLSDVGDLPSGLRPDRFGHIDRLLTCGFGCGLPSSAGAEYAAHHKGECCMCINVAHVSYIMQYMPKSSDVGFYLAVFGRTGSGILTCAFGFALPSLPT